MAARRADGPEKRAGPPVAGKDVRARFDGGRLSCDGGVLLLREIENGLAIADILSSCLKDARDPASTTVCRVQKNSVSFLPVSDLRPLNTIAKVVDQ